jgi:hypothetical protein
MAEALLATIGSAARPEKSCTLDHRHSSGRTTKPAFTGFPWAQAAEFEQRKLCATGLLSAS